MSEDFWSTVSTLASTNEANVETWFVVPLLEALGHTRDCIDAKPSIVFQEGREKRIKRPDFVVYAERPFSQATSLIVVETKRPEEPLTDGRHQGESYAQNLRAPLLLITNGRLLEVWQSQLTTESTKVLGCEVATLASRRADLEALLARDAVKAHCATLEHKRFDGLARDLSPYERAEAARLARPGGRPFARALRDRAAERDLDWTDLMTARGAVIVGPSGFGKTMLSEALVREALDRRIKGKAQVIPFDVFLPDLAVSGRTLEDFLADRVAGSKPGFSRELLRALAREQGLLIVGDGFERLAPDQRAATKMSLRTLRRDFPKTQLIVLSRAHAAPDDIDLPLLHLEGYTRQDMRKLAEGRFGPRPNGAHAFSGAPEHIYRLSEVPLLASLVLDHYQREGRHTARIAPLYELWLDKILTPSRPIDRALDRILLESLARETVSGPISAVRAVQLAEPRSDPEHVLNRLADVDAISLRGGATVELPHEALADYLRALQFWREAPESSEARLEALELDPSSQFAALLVDTAPTPHLRDAAWQAVAKKDLLLAIRSLRFAAGDQPTGDVYTDEQARRFLADIKNTIETLLTAHFAPIADLLREEIAGLPLERLGIRGGVSADNVSFSFFEAKGAQQDVRLGLDLQDRAPRMYGHALQRVGYGPEAGRIIGVQRLKEDLFDLVKTRRLRGGPIWTQERVFGRLRHLASRYGDPIDNLSLQEAHDALVPYINEWVGDVGSAGQPFPMKELLDDITWLIGQGISRIDPWWEDLRQLNLHTSEGQAGFARTLDAYHHRRQRAYLEVVENSFPRLRQHLRTLRMMPLRFEVEVGFHTRGGLERLALEYRRWPVATYVEAGADVSFPQEKSDRSSDAFAQSYIDRTDTLLSRFGRYFTDRIIISGGMRIPDLLGHDTSFDGLADESAVVRGVMDYLKDDLQHLFAELRRTSSLAGHKV